MVLLFTSVETYPWNGHWCQLRDTTSHLQFYETLAVLFIYRSVVHVFNELRSKIYLNHVGYFIFLRFLFGRNEAKPGFRVWVGSLVFFEVINNTAVCLLYIGRPADALNVLSSENDVPNEPTCINFVSIAELATCDVKQRRVSILS